VIVGLVALVILLITVPVIGDFLRGVFSAVLGDTLSSILGAIANIIGVGSFLFFLVRWVLAGRSSDIVVSARGAPTNAAAPSAPLADAGQARRTVEEARELATRVHDLAHRYRSNDPLNDEDGDVLMNPQNPRHAEVMAEYHQHIDEMRGQYRSNLLPHAVQVRGALQDLGISDSQFEQVYTKPKNYDDMEAVAERLWDMAGRLERKIGD
jgi:hypothetical protein